MFGIGLCRLFNAGEQAAPSIVLRLIQEMERQAAATPSLDVYLLYRTTPSFGAIAELRSHIAKGFFHIYFYSLLVVIIFIALTWLPQLVTNRCF